MKLQQDDLRQEFFRLKQVPVLTCELLKDGISNTNYLINGEYVYKQKTFGLDPFFDMSTEIYCQKKMAEINLAPKLLNYDLEKAILISHYIKNTRYLQEPLLPREMQLVASTINHFHSLEAHNMRKFNPLLRYHTYRDLAGGPVLMPLLEKQLLAEFTTYFAQVPLVVSHNDVVRGNLLFDNHHLYLIDYEYAGLNDPLFDHLSFLSENNLDQDENIARYLRYALGEQYVIDFTFINRYILFLDFLWYYWARAYQQKTQKPIFATIAHIKKTRIETRLHLTNF